MLASTTKFIEANLSLLRRFLAGLHEACELFQETKSMPQTISEVYGLKLEDAQSWYKTVCITASSGITESSLRRAVDVLYQTKAISKNDYDIELLIAPQLAEVETDIKHMKLYSKPEIIKFLRNSLIAIGKTEGPLSYEDLLPYDQHHYFGTKVIDENAHDIQLAKGNMICNIGSGLGGPARYAAGRYGAQVLAIELQDDLHRTASELTQRCGLNDLVHHIAGDFLQVGQYLQKGSFDSIVSWLTVLHIQNREKLYQIAFDLLKPGGVYYAEDFIKRSVFTTQEMLTLQTEVACPYVPDMITYKGQLVRAGFDIIRVDDLSASWQEHTQARVQQFKDQAQTLMATHRKDTYDRLLSFYSTVATLFQGGNLGGARFLVRKPL